MGGLGSMSNRINDKKNYNPIISGNVEDYEELLSSTIVDDSICFLVWEAQLMIILFGNS